MNRERAEKLIERLRMAQLASGFYFFGVSSTTDALFFIAGFMFSLNDEAPFQTISDQVTRERGWIPFIRDRDGVTIDRQMLEKGMTPHEVIHELFEITIETIVRTIDRPAGSE